MAYKIRLFTAVIFWTCFNVDYCFNPSDICPSNEDNWRIDENNGEYRCILSCSDGYVPSGSHVIRPLPDGGYNKPIPVCKRERILVAPILDNIKNVTVVKGQDAVFTCKIIVSDSQPLLSWLRHYKVKGSYVDENDQPYVHRLQQSGLIKTIDDPQYLTIKNATEDDAGWYICLVANSVGQNYRSSWLTVLNGLSIESGSTLVKVGAGVVALYALAAAGFGAAGVAVGSLAAWLQGQAMVEDVWLAGQQLAGAAGFIAANQVDIGMLGQTASDYVMNNFKDWEPELCQCFFND